MPDYLAREDAPLDIEDWKAIDSIVVEAARKRLTGRKFVNITGPLGVSTQFIESPILNNINDDNIEIKGKEILSIPLIYKDFKLNWRDMESAKQGNMPLELAPAAVASVACALKEDEMIFYGNDEYGYKGLMNAKNGAKMKALDWKTPGNAFQNVIAAIETLSTAGFYGPYAMVASPSLYAMMHRVYSGTGSLEISMIKELISDGVFQTPILKGESAAVMNVGRENFDLVIGQDLITAYLGPDGMDHLFRVLETVILRIKRPGSICVFS